jgi:ATP-dependent DNA helicase RecG
MHERLAKLLPEARIAVAHGQMRERDLERVMRDFYAQRSSLLLCTTIIETGIDVPTANTIVIHRADRFGLAQLHQLRGRIGRGPRESVCILLYAAPLSEGALARLKVIFENTDGFKIALADLRLRGPGEFLGERQSGMPLLRYADLEKDEDLAKLAHEAAERLLQDDEAAARRHVERWLSSRSEFARA